MWGNLSSCKEKKKKWKQFPANQKRANFGGREGGQAGILPNSARGGKETPGHHKRQSQERVLHLLLQNLHQAGATDVSGGEVSPSPSQVPGEQL